MGWIIFALGSVLVSLAVGIGVFLGCSTSSDEDDREYAQAWGGVAGVGVMGIFSLIAAFVWALTN